MRLRIAIGVLVVSLLCGGRAALAGGPFVVDTLHDSGKAATWKDGTLVWCADPGDLSAGVNHDTAVKWVTDLLKKWTGVTLSSATNTLEATTVVKTQQSTECSKLVKEDITESNYHSYIDGETGPTVVIFDETGNIVEDYTGGNTSDLYVGLSLPSVVDSTGTAITKGWAIFNGKMLTNGKLGANLTESSPRFQASMLHELGHLLGLDHSQVNFDIASGCKLGQDCADGNDIPTMFPQLLTSSQGELARDDKVTISWLYPSDNLNKDFCTITGEVFDKGGRALKGVNVIASNVKSPTADARAFVSGAMHAVCKGDSRYYLYGIRPGETYKVTYEPLGAQFTGPSGFGPLDNPPQGTWKGTINTTDDKSTVVCDKGGKTIDMASVTIDTANPCFSSSQTASAETSTGKSSCSLVQGSGADGSLLLLLFAAAFIVFARAAMPRYETRKA